MAAPNLLILVQAGRLEFQAIIFAASLRHAATGFTGRLIVAEPQPDGAWAGHDTRIAPETRDLLESFGAEIMPFTARHFGAAYPYGNKIEALSILPEGQPFVFFDTDTLVAGPLDRVPCDGPPAASMRREGTWPHPPPLRSRIRRDLAFALRPVRAGFPVFAGHDPAGGGLGTIPVFQRRLVLWP